MRFSRFLGFCYFWGSLVLFFLVYSEGYLGGNLGRMDAMIVV